MACAAREMDGRLRVGSIGNCLFGRLRTPPLRVSTKTRIKSELYYDAQYQNIQQLYYYTSLIRSLLASHSTSGRMNVTLDREDEKWLVRFGTPSHSELSISCSLCLSMPKSSRNREVRLAVSLDARVTNEIS